MKLSRHVSPKPGLVNYILQGLKVHGDYGHLIYKFPSENEKATGFRLLLSACLIGGNGKEKKGKKCIMLWLRCLVGGKSILLESTIQLSDEILIPSKIEWNCFHSNSSKTYS